MINSTKKEQIIFLFLLTSLAVVFSYLWLKAEKPVILNSVFFKTEDEQALSADSGQIYSVELWLKSLIDYQVIFKDIPISLSTFFHDITEFPDDLSTPFELPLSLDLPDPLYQNVNITLQSSGDENGFIITQKFSSNLHAFSLGMPIALIIVLFLFALQWNKSISKISNRISTVILFLLFCFIFQHFCRMLLYELSGVFNSWDTPIFWTVGRGIVNGIPPYTGLFDIKPPGIFILSAISFYFFDSPIFTHIVQAIVLIIIAIVPLLAYIIHSKDKSIFGLAFSIFLGLLLSLYSSERSGQVEVESFGAAFGAIAILFMLSSFEKYKIFKILGTSLCLLISCGFKEPFLFPILGASLFLCKNIKDWLLKFAIPLAIALCLGVIILLSLGWFGGFLQYLSFMTSTHVSAIGSSPLERSVIFWKLFDNLNLYSLSFGYLFIGIFCALLWINRTKPLQILLLIISLFLASLSVAIGGEYACHHFIFAIPFYAAILIKYNANSINKTNALLFPLLAFSILNLPDIDWEKRSRNFNQKKTNAPSVSITEYLDNVIEQTGTLRFVNLCKNTYNDVFICYSSELGRHSPQGPYFLMDHRFFNRIPDYADSVLNYVKNGQIAIYSPLNYMPVDFQLELKNILEEYYTPIPWKEIEHIPKPENAHSMILFRKR
jgi:hypothetical protein